MLMALANWKPVISSENIRPRKLSATLFWIITELYVQLAEPPIARSTSASDTSGRVAAPPITNQENVIQAKPMIISRRMVRTEPSLKRLKIGRASWRERLEKPEA